MGITGTVLSNPDLTTNTRIEWFDSCIRTHYSRLAIASYRQTSDSHRRTNAGVTVGVTVEVDVAIGVAVGVTVAVDMLVVVGVALGVGVALPVLTTVL